MCRLFGWHFLSIFSSSFCTLRGQCLWFSYRVSAPHQKLKTSRCDVKLQRGMFFFTSWTLWINTQIYTCIFKRTPSGCSNTVFALFMPTMHNPHLENSSYFEKLSETVLILTGRIHLSSAAVIPALWRPPACLADAPHMSSFSTYSGWVLHIASL